MDLFARLDRLEDFVANAKKVPLSNSVLVNESEFYDLLDDIRATLPGELKQARLVSKEKERILAEAQRSEEEMMAKAEARAEAMMRETEIVKAAELEKEHILESANEEGRKIIYDAEDFADRIFGETEAALIDVRDSTEEILGRVGSWREKLRGYTAEEPVEEAYEYEETPEE